jgi:hypothetical protein
MTNVESNVHVKVAMADVLGLLVIAMFTAGVAGVGLGANGDFSLLKTVNAIGPWVAIATLIAAIFAYMNENLLGTAIFGPLAVFFFAMTWGAGLGGIAAAYLCMIIGVIILIDAIVAFAQPVKLLPILLLVAAIAFFVTAMWYNDNNGNNYKAAVGALWLVYTLISFYMAAAIMILVMKGKPILPLLIKA